MSLNVVLSIGCAITPPSRRSANVDISFGYSSPPVSSWRFRSARFSGETTHRRRLVARDNAYTLADEKLEVGTVSCCRNCHRVCRSKKRGVHCACFDSDLRPPHFFMPGWPDGFLCIKIPDWRIGLALKEREKGVGQDTKPSEAAGQSLGDKLPGSLIFKCLSACAPGTAVLPRQRQF